MTTAVSNDQKQKWNEAVTEFAQEIHRQYHGLDDSWTTALVEEVKALGLAAEYISKRSLMAAFRNCVGDKRIILPKSEPVLTQEIVDRIKASFPPIIKSVPREISQRDKSALAGIAPQSGRKTAADRRDADSRSSQNVATARDLSRLSELRTEYRALKVQAELAMGENPRNHASTYAIRKSLLAKLNADPKFKEVRDQS
jgi:hypothetical protein